MFVVIQDTNDNFVCALQIITPTYVDTIRWIISPLVLTLTGETKYCSSEVLFRGPNQKFDPQSLPQITTALRTVWWTLFRRTSTCRYYYSGRSVQIHLRYTISKEGGAWTCVNEPFQYCTIDAFIISLSVNWWMRWKSEGKIRTIRYLHT